MWFSDNVKNSELSLGAGYDVVSRNDRRAGKHGGLLIADTKLSNLHVTDISISDYHFSLACVPHSDTLFFYLLIYNPPASSSYHVHFDDLFVCLRSYFQLFEKFRNQYGCLSYVIYLLGDFNLPGINWQTYTGSSRNECSFLELINELGVTQVVDRPTHKQNNILDLILTTANEIPFIIVDKLFFSDHYPIIFHCSINEHPAHIQSSYSRSSFDPLVFNSCLHDLCNYISRDNSSDPSFLDSFFYLLNLSLEKSLRKKRNKRLALPSYYSSHTINLLNQKFTNSRKLFRKWSLELSLSSNWS